MDVSRYLEEIRIAPRDIFDNLPERATRPRFMLPTADGDWRAITWGGFAQQIRRVTMFLNATGLQAGERVAILAPNRVEWCSAALGIQAAGGAIVPIYPSSTGEQIAYILEHSDAVTLFIDTPALLARLYDVWPATAQLRYIVCLDSSVDPLALLAEQRRARPDHPWPTLDAVIAKLRSWSSALAIGQAHDDEHPQRFERTLHGVSIDQPAVLQYTSGTTGNPKGVPLTHRNVGCNGHDWLRCNGPQLDERPIDLLWLPLSHVFGFGELCLGNTLGFLTYWSNPLRVLSDMPVVRPSVFMSVPRFFEKLAAAAMAQPDAATQAAKLAEVTGGRLKFLLSGGAGLKLEVKEFFYRHGLLITEGYGLTEASPTLTLNRHDAFRFDSVGKPLPSVEIKLAEDGEILAKGPNIFGGYHKDPEATAGVFTEDGWLKTGDVGVFTDDGFLRIVDRKKEIIVTAGGKNIPPANIEVRFADSPHVAHAIVYGESKPCLVACIWPHPELELDAEALRAAIEKEVERVNDEVARHESIKAFEVIETPLSVENGLLTPTLKVKRKRVYEVYRDRFESLYR